MTAPLPWFTGELDDENLHVVLIPKTPLPLQPMPATCGNRRCRYCYPQGVAR